MKVTHILTFSLVREREPEGLYSQVIGSNNLAVC